MKFVFGLRLVRVGGKSPSRSFHEPVHLSAFLFASFPNAYESIFDNIQSYTVLDFPSKKPPRNKKRRTRVLNLKRVRHLESFK